MTSDRTRLYSMQQHERRLDRACTGKCDQRLAIPLARVPNRGGVDRHVSVPYLFFRWFVTVTHFSNPTRPTRPIGLRALMGLAVGGTWLRLVMSPWGQRSGGHFNPALTVAFYRLRKMDLPDAAFLSGCTILRRDRRRVCCQISIAGHDWPTRRAVRGNRTRYSRRRFGFYRGTDHLFYLMSTILVASNRETLARYTPYLVGVLYATFITLESPLSGMSMNPARSLGPALHASYWHGIWLYFVAPTSGMLVAAEVFLRSRSGFHPYCAKLHHANNKRCIFRHGTAAASRQAILRRERSLFASSVSTRT